MKEEVVVKVHSTHQGEQEEVIKTMVEGRYSFVENRHSVRYQEVDPEHNISTDVTLHFLDNQVEMIRKGMGNTRMFFKKNQKTCSMYQTPYGELEMGMHTTEIRVKETEEQIQLLLCYALEMNQSHVANCKVEVTIEER